MPRVFLTAEWRKLAMANYIVDPSLLQRYLPHKTELDLWHDACYVSLVGFMFVNTRLLGFRIPFHSTFEEVNLRFYVRYKDSTGWKRGVVFIKEIVPKRALTFVVNSIYKENYETMPMMHRWETDDHHLTVEYRWKLKEWNSLEVKCTKEAIAIAAGSEEEFIAEHYWGYTKVGEQRTSEYGVEHPRWQVYPVQNYAIHVGFGNVYGTQFDFLKNETPASVFLAEGSDIIVREGLRI